jgi:glucuronate isomerase
MTANYINQDFLLTDSLAIRLFHEVASTLPVIDFHSHLDAKEIVRNTGPKNLAEAWLKHDHYFWRAMRSIGIDEHYITGSASDYEKFSHWCKAVPYLVGNPLYHWSHLELARFFECHQLLNTTNAMGIWQQCTDKLASSYHQPRALLEKLNVQTLCTTDSPLASLEYHSLLAVDKLEGKMSTNILPTFRADDLFAFHDSRQFLLFVRDLELHSSSVILCFDDYIASIEKRMQVFHQQGCRLADLGLPTVEYKQGSPAEVESAFQRLLARKELTIDELLKAKTYLFTSLGELCHQFGWSWQLHVGVSANVNSRRKEELGPCTGFSIINDDSVLGLASLLDSLDKSKQLPKTVLYNLNPNNNAMFVSLCGAFQDSDNNGGKIQFGPAWWFNDHKQGIESQLTALKNMGALGGFIGMATDSRNLMSLSRHEYFRRILCNQLSLWVAQGDIPNDWELLTFTVRNICYSNANAFFDF